MALVKLFLLIVGVVAQEYAVTPPNVQPPSEQLREQHGAESSLSSIVLFMRVLLWTWALLEGPVLFALSGYCPPALAQHLMHGLVAGPAALASLTSLTPTFVAGIVLTLAGTFLRAHCYRALGPQFTFQLSIRPTHALVTHGVYSVVRHPSYTGFVANALGYLFCALDARGTIAALLAWHVRALACMWAVGVYLLYALLHGRMKREDAMLESKFGEEWRAWRKRVPWRLIPGVY